jgi:AhpC/TSA family
MRSQTAARELAGMGYINVRDYPEGKSNWIGGYQPRRDPTINLPDKSDKNSFRLYFGRRIELRIMKLLTPLLQITFLVSLGVSASSRLPINFQRNAPVAVGDFAPDFTLEDQNRNKVTLSNARGKSPVVLVFYRGYW